MATTPLDQFVTRISVSSASFHTGLVSDFPQGRSSPSPAVIRCMSTGPSHDFAFITTTWVPRTSARPSICIGWLCTGHYLTRPFSSGTGAAFDFHAGTKPQAPRWMQRACLERFFRLCTEPRRLFRRYLKIVPAFLILFGMQLLGLRRYEAASERN